MPEQDSFAAQLVGVGAGAHLQGLHGRCSGLGQLCHGVRIEIGALIQGQSTLGDLHTEGHTGGAAALLTVLFGRQLKNIKTFESHSCVPPSRLHKFRDELLDKADDRKILDNLKNYHMETFSMHRD